MYNILVVDDDKEIVNAIEIYLSKEGYNILKAYNGMEALKIMKEREDIHLVILDIMMPKLDGISTANLIRKDKKVPIIMLSAKSEDYDKISGLNNGADDYVTKPFNPLELIARVNSQIRRYTTLGSIADKVQKGENIYRSGDLVINDNTKQVEVEGKEVKLTPTEYNILKFLTKNKGIVYSIEQIYENVWEEECYGAENIIAVHIRHIREKIEINPKEPKYLKVIWGIGYKIENLD
jgi:DNA-binding response OmpR family regulator